MRISSLEIYGVHHDLLAAWEKAHGPELLPAQEEAVKHGVLEGKSLIVSAPTGSGKTFIGEMAAARAAKQGRKVLCLVPTKALAESKWEAFKSTYGPLGLRVAITTRDRRSDDRAIEHGEFDILVTIPEKLRAMLGRASALARQFGVVVADELQMLGDDHRGACYEALLTDLKVAAGEAGVQFVGLSAVLGNPEDIAEWLGAETVCTTKRPVELRKGALVGGSFEFREHNTGEAGSETLMPAVPVDDAMWLPSLVTHLVRAGETALVFVRDKATCVRVAGQIAQTLEDARATGPCAEVLAEIEALEPNAVRRQLRATLAAGVAFHNADMQFPERRAIEAGFRNGGIRVLCATSSLAMGVHLPARNVVIDPVKWDCDPLGPGALRPISVSEFENMAGRAGRPGFGEAFGRAILPAETGYVAGVLMERYVTGEVEPVRSRLASLPVIDRVLRAAGGVAAGTEGVRAAYQQCLAARQGAGGWTEQEEEAAERLHREALLARRSDGTWHATPLGRLCGASGMSFAGFSSLLCWARRCPGAPGDAVALAVAALCPDAADRLPLSAQEARGEELAQRFRGEVASGDVEIGDALLHAEAVEPVERLRAIKQVLALQVWTGWDETEDIERALRATAGRISAVGEGLAWLVQVLAEIGRQLGWPQADTDRLARLASRVGAGLPEEAAGLEGLLREGVSRSRLLQLAREGHTDCASARAAIGDDVRPQATERPTIAAPVTNAPPMSEPKAEGRGPELRVEDARPDRVIFHGASVPVRPTEYRLMRLLAERAGSCVGYGELQAALWGPGEIVEPGQVHWHRSRLAKKLIQHCGEAGGSPIRTIPRRGLILDLQPAQVCVS